MPCCPHLRGPPKGEGERRRIRLLAPMAINAEIATYDATAHEGMSACGPVGLDIAVHMHTNERVRWEIDWHSNHSLQWLTCSTSTPVSPSRGHSFSQLSAPMRQSVVDAHTCRKAGHTHGGWSGADLLSAV